MKLWSKLLDWLGFEEVEDESQEPQEEDIAAPPMAAPRFRPNVVELQPNKNLKLVVLGPRSYDDVQQVADQLRAKRPVVVNLEMADPKARMRVLDFLSGAIYALGGRSQRVSELIFLFAPANVDINNLLDEELSAIAAEGKSRRTGGL
ncbi:MAG: cell division protein SepF [Bacillota bacterium]|jgi:cell division inhibitor SepF